MSDIPSNIITALHRVQTACADWNVTSWFCVSFLSSKHLLKYFTASHFVSKTSTMGPLTLIPSAICKSLSWNEKQLFQIVMSSCHSLNTTWTCSHGHKMKRFSLKTSQRHFVHAIKRNIVRSKFHSFVTWHVRKWVHPYLFISNMYSLCHYHIFSDNGFLCSDD